jgi:hypothetical protein
MISNAVNISGAEQVTTDDPLGNFAALIRTS